MALVLYIKLLLAVIIMAVVGVSQILPHVTPTNETTIHSVLAANVVMGFNLERYCTRVDTNLAAQTGKSTTRVFTASYICKHIWRTSNRYRCLSLHSRCMAVFGLDSRVSLHHITRAKHALSASMEPQPTPGGRGWEFPLSREQISPQCSSVRHILEPVMVCDMAALVTLQGLYQVYHPSSIYKCPEGFSESKRKEWAKNHEGMRDKPLIEIDLQHTIPCNLHVFMAIMRKLVELCQKQHGQEDLHSTNQESTHRPTRLSMSRERLVPMSREKLAPTSRKRLTPRKRPTPTNREKHATTGECFYFFLMSNI